MAYSEDLATRFRDASAHLSGMTEKRMTDGLCFMRRGNMLKDFPEREVRQMLN